MRLLLKLPLLVLVLQKGAVAAASQPSAPAGAGRLQVVAMMQLVVMMAAMGQQLVVMMEQQVGKKYSSGAGLALAW